AAGSALHKTHGTQRDAGTAAQLPMPLGDGCRDPQKLLLEIVAQRCEFLAARQFLAADLESSDELPQELDLPVARPLRSADPCESLTAEHMDGVVVGRVARGDLRLKSRDTFINKL